jgi:ankyrin repeat protein
LNYLLTTGNANSKATDIPVSSFYLACRSGDIDTVKQILPNMKLKEINQVESNGSTALHVAAWYGHHEIVECLLKHGCSTITVNKYEKTAIQECRHEHIRHLIQSSTAVLDNDEQINDHAPQSKYCKVYQNMENQNKSVVATQIMKLRQRTYLTYQFKTNEPNRTDHIKKSFLRCVNQMGQKCVRELQLLEEFETPKIQSI